MLALALALFAAAPPAPAQTFTTLHDFTGGEDGATPAAGLSLDQAGRLFGTASYGGHKGGACGGGCGTVYKLERQGRGWIFTPLYAFSDADGNTPQSRVIMGPDGALYGTTTYGGDAGKGVVFRLQPPLAACKNTLCPWRETVLHSFSGGNDGANPAYGDLAFDQAGNLYGTAPSGGSGPGCVGGCGVVYKLTPSDDGWTEQILYSFQGGQDGASPYAGVVFDDAGNLYGTTGWGGAWEAGTVYQLTPSGQGWTENILYTFSAGADGAGPLGGVIFDSAGNLYGATLTGKTPVYELSPSQGGWTFKVLHQFDASEGSLGRLTFDAAGNLLGTLGSAGLEVFRLTPSGGQWTVTGFFGQVGAYPLGSVVLDPQGNLYTTAADWNGGFVFEISP